MSEDCIHGPGVANCGHPDCVGEREFAPPAKPPVKQPCVACGMARLMCIDFGQGQCCSDCDHAPPPAATPPPEPDTRHQGWATDAIRDRVALTPAPGVSAAPSATSPTDASGETRALVEDALRCPMCRRPLGTRCGCYIRDEVRQSRALDAVLAALAPGPDTARDGEVQQEAAGPWRCCEHCAEDQPHIEPNTHEIPCRTCAETRPAVQAARRERDDLKAAVERLAADFQQRSDKAANERGGYPEAVADKDARERCWNRAAEDLASLLSPPDAGRDTG